MPWHAKNTYGYLKESSEAYDNALMAWSIMNSVGWTLLAFCGMWGNVEHESGYNPWRWENEQLLPEGDPRLDYQNSHAYGLCQWDWAGKYIYGGVGYSGYGPNFLDKQGLVTDGTAQMYFLEDTAVSSGQYFPNPNYPYQISYENYKRMTIDQYSIEWAVRAWFHNYERGTWNYSRVASATYWYNTLGGVDPPDPPAPPHPSGRIPIWLLFKLKERSEGK